MKNIKTFIELCIALTMRFILCILNIFPIKKNRILFYSFNGKQFSCNPYEITKYLTENDDNNYEIIWAFKQPEKFVEIIPKSVRAVKFRSLKYYYLVKTSKVVVYNVHEFGEIGKRRKQVFIQTWHASNGFKSMQTSRNLIEKIRFSLYHKNYSYVLSGCKSMTERRVYNTMNYHGEVIKGTPRMDVLFKHDCSDIKDRVYKTMNISDNTKILLYAPTWRENREQCDYGLDYEMLYNALISKFGGNWIIAVRFHPNVKNVVLPDLPFITNASSYPNMQDLLYTSAILISDYSSSIWDYSYLKRPCFLYCNDYAEYGGDEKFEIPIRNWHFPLCLNMNELVFAIENFDYDNNCEEIRKFHNEMESYEDGKATERVCSLIKNIIAGEKS